MPIIFQHRIYRIDLQANPNVLYVFGDNLLREGMGGQAGEMRGEPNAVGWPTKRKPTMSEDAFFTDSDEDFIDVWNAVENDIDRIIKHLIDGGILVVPSDGIGTGLSQLPERAPEMHKKIEEIIDFWGTL